MMTSPSKKLMAAASVAQGQLPLQVALVRLINEHHPDRLIIEPTGACTPQ